METVETYLARKKQELELLNSFLSDPLTIRPPRSVAEVIEQKFHLAAALKAEHVQVGGDRARLNSNTTINAPTWK